MIRHVLFLFFAITGFKLAAADGGFLFVTFDGERSQKGEQIYFALSKDGSQWESLNGQEPVLVSEIGEKGARDPYLLRGEDGKFRLLATDLSIYLNRNWKRAIEKGSRSILLWESADLVHWSEPRLVQVAPADAGCTWAPEAIYDTANQRYLIYWSSTSPKDGYKKQVIWGVWTKDFQTFSDPFVYIEKPTLVMDSDIVRGDDGKYYRFTEDAREEATTMEVSDSVMGTWQNVPGFTLAKLKGHEGPACFKLKPAENGKPAIWCLLLDAFAKHEGYKPFVTEDLASGNFAPAERFYFPFRFRHGSVLALTAGEFARLQTADGKPRP